MGDLLQVCFSTQVKLMIRQSKSQSETQRFLWGLELNCKLTLRDRQTGSSVADKPPSGALTWFYIIS